MPSLSLSLKSILLIVAAPLIVSLACLAQGTEGTQGTKGTDVRAATFTNPIAVAADPFIVRHEGAYYWCLSENDLGVAICKSDTPASLGTRHVVWRSPETGPYAKGKPHGVRPFFLL